nr:MAG TPA_asm: hypothetical protein [Caudoviricetes sp.]
MLAPIRPPAATVVPETGSDIEPPLIAVSPLSDEGNKKSPLMMAG